MSVYRNTLARLEEEMKEKNCKPSTDKGSEKKHLK
jgi:hypothetical protein